METSQEKYICINCGFKAAEIYKKYSPSVLKLQNCVHCKNVVDKYIEYDLIIIIIDLILLKNEAYRHIIFNTSFNNHWKLAILILLMEAYSEWTINSGIKRSSTKEAVNFEQFQFNDIEFFKLCLKVTFKQICFILSILLLNILNNLIKREKSRDYKLLHVWKSIVLSSFGVFLFLPSLIWDDNPMAEFHLVFVSLYTTLSQLIAYTATCNCTKLCSICVILLSYYLKELCTHLFDEVYNYFQNVNEVVILNVTL